MEISNKRLREFQEAYKKEFNEEVSLEESREMLTRVVTLYQLLSRPLPGEENEEMPETEDTEV